MEKRYPRTLQNFSLHFSERTRNQLPRKESGDRKSGCVQVVWYGCYVGTCIGTSNRSCALDICHSSLLVCVPDFPSSYTWHGTDLSQGTHTKANIRKYSWTPSVDITVKIRVRSESGAQFFVVIAWPYTFHKLLVLPWRIYDCRFWVLIEFKAMTILTLIAVRWDKTYIDRTRLHVTIHSAVFIIAAKMLPVTILRKKKKSI